MNKTDLRNFDISNFNSIKARQEDVKKTIHPHFYRVKEGSEDFVREEVVVTKMPAELYGLFQKRV